MKRPTRIITNAVIFVMLLGLIFFAFYSHSISKEAIKPYYKCDTEKAVVCLMINVYENTYIVEEMLKVLKNFNAKATFFLGGIWVDKNVNTVKMIAEYGMEIGSHGYLHRDHSKLSYEQNREEILISKKVIEGCIGKNTYLFAPPSGAFNDNTLKVCESVGYSLVMWSKDTIDWRDHNVETIYRRATKNITYGDFVLMHPTECTLKALPLILEYYLKVGLSPMTVSEAVLTL